MGKSIRYFNFKKKAERKKVENTQCKKMSSFSFITGNGSNASYVKKTCRSRTMFDPLTPKIAIFSLTPKIAILPLSPKIAIFPLKPKIAIFPLTPKIAIFPLLLKLPFFPLLLKFS